MVDDNRVACALLPPSGGRLDHHSYRQGSVYSKIWKKLKDTWVAPVGLGLAVSAVVPLGELPNPFHHLDLAQAAAITIKHNRSRKGIICLKSTDVKRCGIHQLGIYIRTVRIPATSMSDEEFCL